jgi:hypothetical protein
VSDRITADKPLIVPIYSQSDPNEPIALGQVAVQFDFQGTKYDKLVDVTMAFLPKHRLSLATPFEDGALVLCQA